MSQKDLRRTGLSTAIALEFIADRIRRPLEWSSPTDHFPHPDADHHLAGVVSKILLDLNLEFEVRKRSTRIEFRSMRTGFVVEESGEIRVAKLEDFDG